MSAAPGKGKMKKELAEHIQKLQNELGLSSQEKLAELLDVSRPLVSQWLAPARKEKPTPEMYLRMGLIARDPEQQRWFWKQSGFPIEGLKLRVAELLTPAPTLGQLTGVLAEPIPAGAQPFTVTENIGGMFSPGDVFIIEPAADPNNPEPYWDQLVLVEFPAEKLEGPPWFVERWPKGLYVGRLRCKMYDSRPALFYLATVGPLNDSEGIWRHHSESLPVGSWQHAGPPKDPAPGSGREKAQREAEAAAKTREELYRKAYRMDLPPGRRPSSIHLTPELEAADKALSLAQSKTTDAENDELIGIEKQAKLEAPGKISLYPGITIVGRVLAWFPAQKRQR